MSTQAATGNRRYCRTALTRVSRTFAINIRLLSGSMRDTVGIAYLLCRTADTLEDSWPGDAATVRRRFDVFLCALGGCQRSASELAREAEPFASARADMDLVAHLPVLERVFASLSAADRDVIRTGVETLAHGMKKYAGRAAERAIGGDTDSAYLESEAELHDYCWVVAGCVGVMLTRLFSHRARASDAAVETKRLALAPVVGEALQLTNILLDWPIDVRRGRCYVPAEWLDQAGLAPHMLVDQARADVQVLAARLESLAQAALGRVPDYLDLIPVRHVRYRLFCLWPALWAQSSLRHARQDPEFPWGARRPRLPRRELWGAALRSLMSIHDHGALRRLYAKYA